MHRMAFVMSLAVALAACGGGGSGGSPTTTADTSTSVAGMSLDEETLRAAAVRAAASSSSIVRIGTSPTASSSSASSSVVATWTSVPPAPGFVTAISSDSTISSGTVVTFGQVFPAGEISSGQLVQASTNGTPLPTQTDVKRRYADGSIRHAVLSVRLPAVAATGASKALASMSLAATGTASAGAPLSLASVNGSASPVDYRVEIYEHGLKADGTATAESGKTWTTTLKAALTSTTSPWLAGPLVSEWRARVAPAAAGAAHPSLRVIFDARYQSASQGRVSITLENVESNAARGDRTYDIRIYDATTGGTAVFSQNNVLHYAHTRYRKAYYFGTGMKEIMAIADVARLKNARAIPNYANVTIPEATLSASYLSWQSSNRGLYQAATITPGMANTGGRPDIGPLPGWTAMALISGDPRMYQIMLDHADRAGMWNVHWRDSLLGGATTATADIFSIDTHPNFALFNSSSDPASYVGSVHINWMGDALPAPSLPFTTPAGWQHDTDHEPSLAYLPYVVTGDQYYLDELYFYADWHFMNRVPAYRGYGNGLVSDYQVRGQAWSMRTMGHAAWIAPDTHWQKDYFSDKLNKNLAWYRANVMTTNSLGYWASDVDWRTDLVPDGSNLVAKVIAPWQHHFMAYTLTQLCDWGYAAGDVRDFALGFSTRLFTSGSDYNRFDGTTYYLPTKLKDGTYINSMIALNYHSFVNRTSGVPTELAGYNSPDGYAAQALTALSGSIDAGVPNASAGYVFVRNEIMRYGNSNRQNFVSNPTWNIVPRGTVTGLAEAPGIYTK